MDKLQYLKTVNSCRGLTLLSVLVAVFILTSTLTVAASLLARSEHTVSLSSDMLIATNLARESMESVYAWRDTNMLQGRAYHDGLCEPGDSQVPLVIWFDYEIDDLQTILFPDANEARLRVVDGVYVHQAGGTGEVSKFSRMVTIDCSDVLASVDDSEAKDKLLVESRVYWDRDGVEEDVVLKAELYDWYAQPSND